MEVGEGNGSRATDSEDFTNDTPESLDFGLGPGGRRTIVRFGPQYRIEKELGRGAFAIVCRARDRKEKTSVAVKVIFDPFYDVERAKKLIREIRLLKHFRSHPNILSLLDVLPPWETERPGYVCLSTELMDIDLKRLLKQCTPEDLTPRHISWFMYQLLSGLDALHRANVLHRDLKPENILVCQDCQKRGSLKIADFGLSRDNANPFDEKSAYVVTRHYRPPELICSNNQYSSSVDIWSLGCIFAEMYATKHNLLFPGKDYLAMLRVIILIIGSPSEEDLAKVSSEVTVSFLRGLGNEPRKDLRAFPPSEPYFPATVPKCAVDFLSRCLQFAPGARASAAQLLRHKFLDYNGEAEAEGEGGGDEDEDDEEEEEEDEEEDEEYEPIGLFDPSFEEQMTDLQACREILGTMVCEFHPEYRDAPNVVTHASVTAATGSPEAADEGAAT